MHTLIVGIVISLLLTEVTGISPGGIVAAGYLAMFALQPVWLAGTIIAALVTYWIMKLMERRLLLYGRRQFALYVLAGITVSQLLTRFAAAGHWDVGLLVIGYLIPGLIARDFARQGIVHTTLVMSIAVVLTRLCVLAGEGWLW